MAKKLLPFIFGGVLVGALIFGVQWWRISADVVITPPAGDSLNASSTIPSTDTIPTSPTVTPIEDLIRVTTPRANDFIDSPVTITGEARGTWYFEASFPVQLLDKTGKVIASGAAEAQGEWMTEQFVPFKLTLTIAKMPVGAGTLVLKKDNPSGDPVRDRELRLPVRFEPPSAAGGDEEAMPKCRVTGCSHQVCSDTDVSTTCEYRAEYACYQTATCARQETGRCGWTMTPGLLACLGAGGPDNIFPQ